MSFRYTSWTGESICFTCGEVVHELPPVRAFSQLPPPAEHAAQLRAMEAADTAHHCGPFTDWVHAARICTQPHELLDVLDNMPDELWAKVSAHLRAP